MMYIEWYLKTNWYGNILGDYFLKYWDHDKMN
jgi:hypothetical protein